MTANDDSSEETPVQLIRFCENFQRELRIGSQPRIENYLASWGERPQREQLFAELLKLEVQFLQGQRQTISPEGYETRFPEDAEAIRQLVKQEMPSGNGILAPSEGVHVRCPHCHNPIELVDSQSLNDIECPSCGSSFSLLPETETVTFRAPEQETIGHFTLEQRLGVGAFGAVWRAQDQQLDRKVAIKVPRKGQLSAKETEQFLREARAAAQLRHPNIVSVHEVGRQGDSVYIVSDFVEGITLSDWLTAKKPTFREAAELCSKIAEALHHAHERGVIHRDLKPGNIMLDQEGKPHIMDFGLAKREAGEITMTMDGQILGTPAYMSPEQARGEGHKVDRRADIYSLGVILFELLTGELPFRGNTRMLIHQLLTEDAPSPCELNASVPRDLETICLKCLEKDPSRRYATSVDLSVDLRKLSTAGRSLRVQSVVCPKVGDGVSVSPFSLPYLRCCF